MTNVVPFPPLPSITPPPSGPLDPRQETFYRVIGSITTQLLQGDGAVVSTTDTVTGYRASAVDVGHIQELLEAGIRGFDMDDVRNRWELDLLEWFRNAISGWIQRRKFLHFELADNGIHVSIETQDDRGYYQYELDVFPDKNLRLPRPPTHL